MTGMAAGLDCTSHGETRTDHPAPLLKGPLELSPRCKCQLRSLDSLHETDGNGIGDLVSRRRRPQNPRGWAQPTAEKATMRQAPEEVDMLRPHIEQG